MTRPDFSNARWRTSTRSEPNDYCVEVASDAVWRRSIRSQTQSDQCVEISDGQRHVAVRDSKNPGGAHLVFTAPEWLAFAEVIKSGRLG